SIDCKIGEYSISKRENIKQISPDGHRGNFDTPGDEVMVARPRLLLRKPKQSWGMVRQESDESAMNIKICAVGLCLAIIAATALAVAPVEAQTSKRQVYTTRSDAPVSRPPRRARAAPGR